MGRRKGFILVYAVGTLVLVSALGNTLLDTGGSELEVSKARMFQQLARVNADSGIEYGMGVISRELARARRGGLQGGPWRDPTYEVPTNDCALNWMKQYRAFTFFGGPLCPGLTTSAEQMAEFSAIRMHELRSEGEGNLGGLRWASQFYLALAPEPTFDRVRLETEVGNPHVFVLRCRGEIVTDPDEAGPLPVEVIATAYAFQSFTVEFPFDCPTPRPTRQVWQMDTDPNGQLNWPVKPWPGGAPAQPPVESAPEAHGPVSNPGGILRRPNIH